VACPRGRQISPCLREQEFFFVRPDLAGMPSYNIRGVTVQFPYDAYQCQLIYMEKVIESLQEVRSKIMLPPIFRFFCVFSMVAFIFPGKPFDASLAHFAEEKCAFGEPHRHW
jgi:hypothetical protein